MNNLRIYFVHNNLPIANLIAFWTFSNYSHCAGDDPLDDNYIIEAKMIGGVTRTKKDIFFKKYTNNGVKPTALYISFKNKESIAKFLHQQVGKPYDFGGLLGGVLRIKKWNEPKAWYCSELWAMVCQLGGYDLFDSTRKIITPDQLYIALRQHCKVFKF